MVVARRRPPKWVAVAPGVERQIIAEVGGTEFSVYRLAGGRRFDFHSHPYAEMGVMLTGGARHRLRLDVPNGGGRRTTVVEIVARRGDSFYVPPNVPHAVETFPGKPTLCVDLVFDASGPPAEPRAARRKVRRGRPGRRAPRRAAPAA